MYLEHAAPLGVAQAARHAERAARTAAQHVRDHLIDVGPERGAQVGDARVVGEHVDATPPLRDEGEESVHLRAVGHVGGDPERRSPGCLDLARDTSRDLAVDVRDGDPRPLGREAPRDGTPDPRAAAGHHRDASRELRHWSASLVGNPQRVQPHGRTPGDSALTPPYASSSTRTPSAETSPAPR